MREVILIKFCKYTNGDVNMIRIIKSVGLKTFE